MFALYLQRCIDKLNRDNEDIAALKKELHEKDNEIDTLSLDLNKVVTECEIVCGKLNDSEEEIKELERLNENLERTNTCLDGRVAALFGENQKLISSVNALRKELKGTCNLLTINRNKTKKDTKLNKELYEYNKGFETVDPPKSVVCPNCNEDTDVALDKPYLFTCKNCHSPVGSCNNV